MALFATDDIKKVNFEAIPDEMKNIPQWFVWKHGAPDKNGKLRKIPHNLKGTKWVSYTEENNYSTFDEVKQAYNNVAGIAGIGFRPKGTDITIIDVDIERDDDEAGKVTGQLTANEKAFLNAGYVETSVSGNGYHAIFNHKPHESIGDKVYVFDEDNNQIEVYHSNVSGWVAITGDIYDNHSQIDNKTTSKQFIDYLAENYAPSESPTESHTELIADTGSFVPPELDLSDVVPLWLNTGNPKLIGRDIYKEDLWHRADEAMGAYSSRSEAINALINELAYFMWDNPQGIYDLLDNNPYWSDYLHEKEHARNGEIKKAINNRIKSGRIYDGQPTAEEDFAPFIAESHTESTQEPTQDKIDKYKLKSAKAVNEALRADIKDNTQEPPTPTGFKVLDNVFDGGLYSGLYVVGAMSSLGKTTFVQQVTDQVAQQGKDVLFFSLEMGEKELVSKSISRETYIHTKKFKLDENNAKTARGISDSSRYYKDDERGIRGYNQQETDTIKAAFERHDEYAGHLYIIEGVGDVTAKVIRDTVKMHEKATGNTPMVVVDYLQLIAPSDMRATDKQNTDRAVLELKKMTRDHNTAVFAISSLNRDSYDAPTTMSSFKESGAIEYSSDVLIALDLKEMIIDKKSCDVNYEKKKTPREVTLTVLKNRSGKTGDRVDYSFHPAYNLFDEVGKFTPIRSAESEFKGQSAGVI